MLVSSIFFCQLLWAEALYLRDQYQENAPNFLQKQEQILKLACLADILDYPDYALELLKYLEVKYDDQQ